MKKYLKIFCLCLILISSSLIFFACKNNGPKTLVKPLSIALVDNGLQTTITLTDENGDPILDENGNVKEEHPYLTHDYLLVTETNTKATSYRFFITDNSDYENLNNYVSYDCEENFLNVTNLFINKKEYHYFVQYIGNDKYLNSAYSNIESFVPSSEKVSAPYIQILNEDVYWTQIINAQNYEVYEKILDKNDNVVQQSTQIASLPATTFTLNIHNRLNSQNYPYYKYYYSVRALASGYYLNSDISNTVEHIKSVSLSVPSNLQINKITDNNRYILSWSEVPYCTQYEIKINNNSIESTTTESLDITSYLTDYASYSFSIKAKLSDAIDFTESAYCDNFNYDYTTKLDAPTNLVITTQGEYIKISFNVVNMADNGYNIKIKYNNSFVINNDYTGLSLNINDNKVNILIKSTDIVGELNSDKDIVVYVKAIKVGEYIFESDTIFTDYTIVKINN